MRLFWNSYRIHMIWSIIAHKWQERSYEVLGLTQLLSKKRKELQTKCQKARYQLMRTLSVGFRQTDSKHGKFSQ